MSWTPKSPTNLCAGPDSPLACESKKMEVATPCKWGAINQCHEHGGKCQIEGYYQDLAPWKAANGDASLDFLTDQGKACLAYDNEEDCGSFPGAGSDVSLTTPVCYSSVEMSDADTDFCYDPSVTDEETCNKRTKSVKRGCQWYDPKVSPHWDFDGDYDADYVEECCNFGFKPREEGGDYCAALTESGASEMFYSPLDDEQKEVIVNRTSIGKDGITCNEATSRERADFSDEDAALVQLIDAACCSETPPGPDMWGCKFNAKCNAAQTALQECFEEDEENGVPLCNCLAELTAVETDCNYVSTPPPRPHPPTPDT